MLGQRYRGMREELTAALGGEGCISPQRALLLEQVCRVSIIVDALDAALLGSGFDPKSPDSRKFLADVNKSRYLLSQLLAQAGLDRQARPVLSPREILALEGEGDEVTP